MVARVIWWTLVARTLQSTPLCLGALRNPSFFPFKMLNTFFRLLMVRAFAERRMPLLRRLSSRVWLSTDQLSRMYYVLKVWGTDLKKVWLKFIRASRWKNETRHRINEKGSKLHCSRSAKLGCKQVTTGPRFGPGTLYTYSLVW